MSLTVMATNDDGIFAPGLTEAVAALRSIPDVNVYVVGPAQQWSAKGHAITIREPLYAERLPDDVFQTPAWKTSGSPADCVKLGINYLIDEEVDLVVSGINSGPNLATDVLYSGTVAAAIEAQIEGVPGLAVSLGSSSEEPEDYHTAATFVHSMVQVLGSWAPTPFLLNVNVPIRPVAELSGVCITELGPCPYRHWVRVEDGEECGRRYWLRADMRSDCAPNGSDMAAVLSGHVSITPLEFFDITDHRITESLKPLVREIEDNFCR